MPQLEDEVWQKYKDDGLVMFAISSSIIGVENEASLQSFVQSMGLSMPVLLDSDGTVYDDYYINDPSAFAPYPREYIIDPSGTIIYTSSNVDIDAIQAVLDQQFSQ